MVTIEHGSLAHRIGKLMDNLRGTPRALTDAEEQVIVDLLLHPDLPEFFRAKASGPVLPRSEGFAREKKP